MRPASTGVGPYAGPAANDGMQSSLSVAFVCANICRDVGDNLGMPEMGRRRFRRGFCLDETVRGQSHSRRVSQACFQNTADKARDVRVIDIRSGAFRSSLVTGAETGLIRVRQGGGVTGVSSAHVETAVNVQNMPGYI